MYVHCTYTYNIIICTFIYFCHLTHILIQNITYGVLCLYNIHIGINLYVYVCVYLYKFKINIITKSLNLFMCTRISKCRCIQGCELNAFKKFQIDTYML